MSPRLDKTNQHNLDDDDEDLYTDPDRLLFLKNLESVLGTLFALVRNSNGDPTFLLYEGLSEDEDRLIDSERRVTRSFTRKIKGCNSLSHNVRPSDLAKKRKNDLDNGVDTKKIGSNLVSRSDCTRRVKRRCGIDEIRGDDHFRNADKVVSGLAKKGKNDQDNGVGTGEVGLNCLSENASLRRNRNPSVLRNVGGDRRSRRGLANDDHSGKVDEWRVRRLSGLRNKRRLAEKLKNIQGIGAEKETSCTIKVQCDQANGVEKASSCEIKAQADQEYGNSNRAYGIWLRNHDGKRCDLENDNVDMSSDFELEVLDEPPQCSEWKYTSPADSHVLDATVRRTTKSCTQKIQGSNALSHNVSPSGLAKKPKNNLDNGVDTKKVNSNLVSQSDRVIDSERRITRSFTRKFQGSNSLSHNVSPTDMAKKQKNYLDNNTVDTKKVGSNLVSQSDRVCDSERRITRSFNQNIQGSNSLPHNVSPSGLAKKPKNDLDNGVATKKVGSNLVSQSDRTRRVKKRCGTEEIEGDVHSRKADKVVSGLAKKQMNDHTGEGWLNCLSQNASLRRNRNPSVLRIDGGDRMSRRGLVNDDHSGKVDEWRVRRLSGLRNRMRLAEKRKNIQGNGAEKETSSTIEVQRDQANGVEKEIRCKIEAQDDQDYGNSNRAYGIWLRNYNRKRCDLENDNVETSSDSDLEVLDEPPQCSEWKYTSPADSHVLDATMEDDDVRYLGERIKPENLQFRKDLEKILGRPYSEKEYESLLLQVTLRKPMQGYRELRGRLKAYSKETLGKSYLDEYLDLQETLHTFQADLPRKLNVLRGFFYYLKNMATEGIFKPWLDESCLAIDP